MIQSRRTFLKALTAMGSTAVFLLTNAKPARASGLYGTWRLRCPTCGQIDTVTDGTRQHKCSRDKTQVFNGDEVTVVCPQNDWWTIHTGEPGLDTFICPVHHVDCNTGPHYPKQSGRPNYDHGKY